MSLTLDEITEKNYQRCLRWHPGGIQDWSVSDWAVAMMGEAGEACNAIKKMNRVINEYKNINEPERQISTIKDARKVIGRELADTFIYMNLLCIRLDINLEYFIREVFNKKSAEYGFPERL